MRASTEWVAIAYESYDLWGESGVNLTDSSDYLRGRAARTAPTLAEVAAIAGVSTATISRFLNSPAVVSGKTAERVRLAIQQTGYVPNLLAGALASNRSRLIAAMVPSLTQSIFSSTIQSMTDALFEAGYNVLLGLAGDHDEHVPAVIDSILGRRPDGLILTGVIGGPELRARLLSANIPIIQIWDLPADPLDMVVGFSHEAVGRAVGQYVLKKGYKSPFLISAGGVRALSRRFGFSRALLEQGFAEPPYVVFDPPTTTRQGRQGLADYMDSGGKPDVVVCTSDWSAQGVMAEIQSRGLKIPDDIAVIGFGDLAFAADLEPALTTVLIDGSQIGRQAARLLLQRAKGLHPDPAIIEVGFQIIERASA